VISTPTGIGGAERVVAGLASAERNGWEQAVFNVAGANPELAAACAPAKIYAPARVSSLPRLAQLPAGGRTLRHVAAFRPDLIHAHLPLAMVAVAGLRRRREAARLATHHHGDHFVVSRRRTAAWLDRAAGGRFDTVVAPSEAVRGFLLSEYRYPEGAVRTIVNGWAGAPAGSRRVEKAADPTVVSIANFRPQKNHELLLRAFALVRERLSRARLLLVGGGPREGEVRRVADALGLGSAVEFTGYVEDVWPYLSRSHLFALSSSYEPLGVAVLEAMAAGLPVVATAVGGVPELVRRDVNGELVEPGDAAAMAAAMTRILSSPTLARSLGDAGRVAAAANTVELMVDRYLALYTELLGAAG
jgi:glycosyltransferase involved in cell wall biosynthesis